MPEQYLLDISSRKGLFFDPKDNTPILVANSRKKIRKPNTRTLSGVLNCPDRLFVDLLEKCFKWDPTQRITPLEAL